MKREMTIEDRKVHDSTDDAKLKTLIERFGVDALDAGHDGESSPERDDMIKRQMGQMKIPDWAKPPAKPPAK